MQVWTFQSLSKNTLDDFLALTPMSADENKDTIYLSFVFHFLTIFSKNFMEKL